MWPSAASVCGLQLAHAALSAIVDNFMHRERAETFDFHLSSGTLAGKGKHFEKNQFLSFGVLHTQKGPSRKSTENKPPDKKPPLRSHMMQFPISVLFMYVYVQNIYIYVCVCVCVCIYTYTYI